VTADQIASGANRIDRLALDVDLANRKTPFDLTSQFDGAPMTAKGQLAQENGGLKLSLDSFAAAPRKIPVKLANAADIVIKDGAVTLTGLTIQAGEGSVTIDGTAGKVLDLAARIDALPLSLANAIAPGLDAAGTTSADIRITGNAATPVIDFNGHIADFASSQTRSAKLPNLAITARGQFADNTLSLIAESTIRDQPTKVEASIKLDGGTVSVPSFKADVGKSSFWGNLALDAKFLPSGRISFDIPDANALASIVGKKAEGALKGTADIASTDGKIGVKLDASGTIRNQAIRALVDVNLDKGPVALPSLKLDVGRNTLSGAVTLGADLLPSGKITFDLPDVGLLAAMAGQKAEGAIKGTADVASANGRIDASVTATGLIRNRTIDIRTNVVSDKGVISVPSLKADIGANTLTGRLSLDKTFLPTGQFSFDFPDIGLLAAFAGQQAQGALKGSATLQSDDGKISGAVKASGETVTAAGLRVVDPTVDLKIADLTAGQLSGHVTADQIAVGANRIDRLALDVDLANRKTHFDLTSQFDGAPMTAKGQLAQENGGLTLTLDSFAAAPRKIPVKLAKPTNIAIRDGAASLAGLIVEAGKGSITIDGAAGRTLDLRARIDALSLSLANTISPGLDAAGTVSADIRVAGDAASPVVRFDSRLAGVATSQTRGAKLPDLTVTAKGQFADNILSLTADSSLRGQPTKVEASVKLDNGAMSVPSFKADIGKSSFSGNLALDAKFQPSGRISFDIPDADALASIVGRKAEGALKGTADIASADGRITVKLDASGRIRKQPIKALADIGIDKGAVSLPSLKLDVGRNTLAGAVTLGADFLPSGKITFDLPDVALLAAMAGQKAEGALKGTADIKSDQGRIDARVAATGLIRKQAIGVNVEAVREGDKISLPSLKIDVGRNMLAGALALDKTFMPTGKLTFDLPDIGLLAAMAGQKAAGAIKGSADIKSDSGKINGAIRAEGTTLTAAGVEIVKPLVDLKIADLATGQLSGKVTADRIAQGTNALAKLSLDFDHAGTKTAFNLKSQYDAAPLTARGAIEQQPDGITVSLDSFAAAPKKIPVKLGRPTEIRVTNGAVALSSLTIAAGKGSVVVNGTAGPKLDLTAKVTALPASLANAFSPGLDAAGTISANVTVKGDPAAPTVAFDTTWQGAAVSQTRSAGLASFTVTAKGELAKNVLSIDANARGGGLSLNANGTVGIAGNRALNIKANGQLPFAALASRLAAQGLDLRGTARFDIAVTGAAANPSISGRITTSGATLTTIRQNLTVKNLAATVELNGKQARIATLTGALSGGGTVSVTGTVDIQPNSGFPADIRIALKNAVYTDAKIVAAKLSGDLTVTGSLVRGPKLGGTIRLRRADITIPQKLPGTLAQIDIRHKHAPRKVLVQAREIKENQPGAKSGTDTGGLQLDLRIVAPRQIFVRGRGLDAELGGKVTLTGSSQAPNASGGFKMLRGRLSIIGRRLDFTEGEISFAGDLTPALNMVATSTVEATTINVVVAGLANNPQVTFTSSPALPQDEVMALLIFGRNSADLSPVQIAQLADAVSTLAGGQSNSLFNKLRQGLGVDDLDVGTDENGKSNVSVGKYLNKRTYLQLQQNVDDNTSSAIINLDIGKGVKLRGEAGSDGSTAGGVFFEKEY
jgi:translocation and assembly module TamB